MEDQTRLPKPELDLPLPEKEIPAQAGVPASQGVPLRSYGRKLPFPKYVFLGIVLVILFAIVGGAYFLGRNSVFKELNPSNPVPPPADPVVYASPTPDPTADWKTFNGNGYTLKYPSVLKTYVNSPKLRESEVAISNYDWNSKTGLFSDEDFGMIIEVSPKNLTLEEMKKNVVSQKEVKSEFEIDGERAIKSVIDYGDGLKLTLVSTINGNNLYTFSLLTGNSKNAKYFDDILSSFKFTN